MFNQVIQVLPTKDYKVYVYFADGKIKLYDASSLVEKGVSKIGFPWFFHYAALMFSQIFDKYNCKCSIY